MPNTSLPTISDHALPLGALMLAASVGSWAQGVPAQPGTLAPVTVTDKAEAPQGKEALQTRRTTVGKGEQELRDIPQSVTVMTEKLIDDVKLDTLREALHYTAGITFAATENGTDQDIRLRGFPIATSGDLMIDGMRDPSQYDRDTFNIERVEVMRGSASMLFGRGSTGGVVNQVMKKPQLADQSDVVGTVGSRGYYRATGDFNIRTGETSALRLNAMWNKADNGGAKIDKNGIAPSYSWGLGTPDEVTVGLYHLKNNNVPVSAIRYLNGSLAPVRPGAFYGTKADFADGGADYLYGQWQHRFGNGGVLRSQIRSGVFERQQQSTAAGFLSGTTAISGATVLTRSGLTPRKDRYKGTYFQSDYSQTVQTGNLRHELLAGVDAAHEKANRFQNDGTTLGTRPNTSVGSPDDGAGLTGTGNLPHWRNSSNYSAKSFGLFAQDLVQVAPMWKVLGGVRYDSFKGDFEQVNYTGSGVQRTPASITKTHLSDSPWSYRGGVLFQPSATQSYHLSYGTSFNTSADTNYTSTFTDGGRIG